MHSRYQLATLKKNALSVSNYYQKARNVSHTLAASNEPSRETELVSYILARLGTNYDL